MVVQTINLTSIPSKIPISFKKFELDQYFQNRPLCAARQAQYERQRDLMNKYLHDWLLESNAKLLTDLDRFMDGSLGLNTEELLFDDLCSNQIQATSLILGMNASDHLPTLNLLEEHVRWKYENIHIIKIGQDVTKRSQLVNLRMEVPSMQKHVFVLIQQLESVEPAFLQNLVHIFHDFLQESDDNRVMLLFCMSGNWNSIAQILPSGSDNRLQIKEPILKDNMKISKEIQSKLLGAKVIPMRIGPNLLEFIFLAFNERDPSIANVQYMINFIVHQYNFKRPAYLTMKKGELVQLFDKQKKLISDLKKLESLKNCNTDELLKVNWKDSLDVAIFCKRHIKLLMEHVEFVFTEMECYFKLLRDETGRSFPGNLFDIYEELINHDELAYSANFMDAISNIAKFPTDALIKRMDLCLIDKENSNKSVLSILRKFRDKLYNNEDEKHFAVKLVAQLHKHAQLLKNPCQMPFHEAILYDDHSAVRKATMPATRLDCLKYYMDETTYQGILYIIINDSPEDMNVQDLFDVFQVSVEKQTKMDDASLKALFLDLIYSMEKQGLIKHHSTLTRPNLIRRCVWL